MTLRTLGFLVLSLAACSRPEANATTPPATAAAPAAGAARLTVQSAPQTTPLAAGAEAPRFQATGHDGTRLEIAGSQRSRLLVVYFYPRDETPGCTVEAQQFRDTYAQLRAAGADVLGVSTDGMDAHRGFANHHSLPFPLVADPDGLLAGAFGVAVSSGYARRMTFLVNRSNRIERAWTAVVPNGHAAEVLAAVTAVR